MIEIIDITSRSDSIPKNIVINTDSIGKHTDHINFNIPIPSHETSTNLELGDIVNIRLVNGGYWKAKVVEIHTEKRFTSDGNTEIPPAVISIGLQNQGEFRDMIVDFEYCPKNKEFYEKKWKDQWWQQYDDEDDTFEY